MAIGNVRNVGALVEAVSNSVSDIFVDHAKSVIPGDEGDDRLANHGHLAIGPQGFDGDIKRIKGALGDAPRSFLDFAQDEGFGLIAEPAVDDRGQVDVYDISGAEFVVARDSMADDFVDADAAAFGKRRFFAGIAEAGWLVSVIERVVMHQPIERFGLHTRFDMGANEVHQLGVEPPGRAHHFPLSFA